MTVVTFKWKFIQYVMEFSRISGYVLLLLSVFNFKPLLVTANIEIDTKEHRNF